MQRNNLIALATIIFTMLISCGHHSDSESSAPKRPSPEEALSLEKQELSSCINCGGGGYQNNSSLCESGETCVGVTISVSGAPVTAASCQKTFLDAQGSQHSYACRSPSVERTERSTKTSKRRGIF